MTLEELFQEYMSYPAFSTTVLSDVNQRGNFGDPPIHLAASRGAVRELQVLIQHGADIEARGDMDSNCTPLHLSVLMGHLDATEFLLKSGADPFARDSDGETPLDYAKRQERREPSVKHSKIVEVLENCHRR